MFFLFSLVRFICVLLAADRKLTPTRLTPKQCPGCLLEVALPLARLPGLAGRGSRRCQAGFQEVSGGQGKSRAPERWPETSKRGVDDDFETFSCEVWSFSVILFARAGLPREVWQGQGQSQDVQGSLELQNSGLRGLEEAWMRIQVEAFSCQVLGAVAWQNGRSSLSRP